MHTEVQHAQAEAKAEALADLIPHSNAAPQQVAHRAEEAQHVPPADMSKETVEIMQKHRLPADIADAVAKRLQVINQAPASELNVTHQKQEFAANE